MTYRAAAVVLCACGALAGCGSSTSTSTSTSTSSSSIAIAARSTTAAPTSAPIASAATPVAISNFVFAPVAVTVKVGAQVNWTNRDSTAHTATANDGSFDTGALNQGQSKVVRFSKPGTYTYHCVFHAFMVGHLIVVK